MSQHSKTIGVVSYEPSQYVPVQAHLELPRKTGAFELSVDIGLGQQMHDFVAELRPMRRSITGDGVRDTLAAIADQIPLEIHEVPTGTPVLDWTVPQEWNIRDAYVRNRRGERVVDFQRCPLAVLGYSIPVQGRFPLSELKPHLFTDPTRPDWIPFRYSYYDKNWGFCLAHRDFEQLEDGEYEVLIDSSLKPGSLTYAECLLPGTSEEEVLVSVHTCHPWMCNDNLSGIAVATALANRLSQRKHRLSYRFIFIPTTIGSITWLSRNEQHLGRIRNGLVLACVGDSGGFHYKRSRCGSAPIDQAMKHVLTRCGEPYTLLEFSPFGFDERQYSSPGFNLPVGCLMRTPNGKYPEYHTSADDLNFVQPQKLAHTVAVCEAAFEVLEGNQRYVNINPRGEPQLGRRGIWQEIGGAVPEAQLITLFWLLSFSDGTHTLLDIAERASIPFQQVRQAADVLVKHRLLALSEE